MVAGKGPDGDVALYWYTQTSFFTECLNRMDSNWDLDIRRLREQEPLSSNLDSFLERVQDVMWNRQFFLCERKGVRSGN